jgi:hypothetical protein
MTPRTLLWNADAGRLRAPWRLLLAAVVLVVALFATGLVLRSLGRSVVGGAGNGLPTAVGAVATAASVVAAVALAGRYLDRRRLTDFGLAVDRDWLVDLGFGLGLGVTLLTGVFLVELAAGWVRVAGTFAADGAFVPAALSALVLFACVGVYEELLARGYLLTNVAEALSPLGDRVAVGLAVLLSAGLFGLAHAGNPSATAVSTVTITLAGVVLALGYVLTADLAIPVGFHVSWNFAQGVVFGFPVSGRPIGPAVVAVDQRGPPVVTGGAFGPEAGLVGVAALLVGAIAICGWVRARGGDLRVHPGITTPASRESRAGTDGDAAAGERGEPATAGTASDDRE